MTREQLVDALLAEVGYDMRPQVEFVAAALERVGTLARRPDDVALMIARVALEEFTDSLSR
jgi:hypothetical protein